MSEKVQIGGQAVLEGVMMRSPHAYTVAVRKGGKPDAEHCANPIIRNLMQPGLWLQRLTTREPSDDQIEVAITAMQEALAMEPR